MLKAICKEQGLDEKIYKPAAVLSRISMAKNSGVGPREYGMNQQLLREDREMRMYDMASVYSLYEARLKAANAMDFDDLLINMLRLMDSSPEVKQKYQQQFRNLGKRPHIACVLQFGHLRQIERIQQSLIPFGHRIALFLKKYRENGVVLARDAGGFEGPQTDACPVLPCAGMITGANYGDAAFFESLCRGSGAWVKLFATGGVGAPTEAARFLKWL